MNRLQAQYKREQALLTVYLGILTLLGAILFAILGA